METYTQRPNVHAMYHLLGTAQSFGTLVNVSCSTGETKHKPIKAHAKRTNNTGVDKQLLRRINTMQTVRFTLDGAFADTHPAITDMLHLIQKTSPRIFGSVAPINLLAEKGGIDEHGEPYPSAIPSISCLRLGVRIKLKDQYEFTPLWACEGTWLRNALEAIYATNPTSRLPPGLPAFRLGYYKRLTFVSMREDLRFHVFRTDDIVQFEGGLYGKVVCFFVAHICGISDYFCMVHPIVFHDADPVLQSSIWRITGMKHVPGDMPVVVPLMYLEHKHPYFIPYAPTTLSKNRIMKHELLWKNEWYTRRY